MYLLAGWLGKATVWLSRHVGGGHGSALPGLVAQKLYPNFLVRLLEQLPDGVVLVSGTNGKTTTTKIIADLLRADGYRVFTNTSGSNYVRGVISAALPRMRHGQLAADIAVLELDEIYATHFVDQVQPRYALLLNVLRDQLDRFGEIDHTADLLTYVAEHTSGTVVLNAGDPRLRKIASDSKLSAKVAWFDASGKASQYYRTDEELHGGKKVVTKSKQGAEADVSLTSLKDGRVTYRVDDKDYDVKLRLFGIHNALNGAAALGVVKTIEGDKFDAKGTVEHLAMVKPAFGRGEIINVGDSEVRLILVKNPSGFQLSLDSSNQQPTLIAINDDFADGRDVSWLWDVDFGGLKSPVSVTGIRAYDMALRLVYGGASLDETEPEIERAVADFAYQLNGKPGQIFATYTAMLKIRDILEKMERNNG